MKKIHLLLLIILIISFIIRVYKIDSVPPSLMWDEAAVGYNAWTIANYGKDEYGNLFPPYFRSFGEGKQPIHIYTTALFVKFFDLSEFSTRLPAALFGILNVLLIFYLTRNLFSEGKQSYGLFNNSIGVLSSLFLAISPQNIHFSRFNHEANFALFFFMMGLLLFFYSIKKEKNFLPLSVLFFILSLFSYNAAKIAVPPFLLLLTALYFKQIKLNKINSLIILIIIGVVISLVYFQPKLLGINRFNQTVQGNENVKRTFLFKKTQNLLLGRINLALTQYSWHFSPQYLFASGDKNPRLSSQTGEFYKIDALFLILGFIYLIYKRSREGILVLGWALVGPLPSSLVAEAPHAARSIFMMGSWHLISALGFYFIIKLVRRPFFKIIVVIVTVIILALSLQNYLSYYYGEYAKRYAIEWQYGMKQIVEFTKQHPEYSSVIVTDVRSQPYIFFLYYLKTPLPEYYNSVIYNNNLENRSYNNVASFDRFSFGGWDPTESLPKEGVLYVLSPSQYDGLRYKLLFEVKKIIYYPNETSAFYLISMK